MSGTTPKIGLKTWEESDPFDLDDFNANSQILDTYAGDYICTSTSRPSWGGAQAGMKIYQTDTRQTMAWSGTAWHEVLTAPPLWVGSAAPGVAISQNTTVSYLLGTITVHRPGTLAVWLSASLANQPYEIGGGTLRPSVDGNAVTLGDGGSLYVSSDVSNAYINNAYRSYPQIPAMGIAAVGVGTHTFGAVFTTINYGTTGQVMELVSVRGMAMLVNSQDT